MIETPLCGSARDDWPRSMRNENVWQQRKEMIDLPHVAGLSAYGELRQDGQLQVPDFDPLDGGVDAQVLFLFEKPGPMTVESGERRGSGFISRDNDDATAEATFRFMRQAAIPRKVTIIWNVIPWWNGTLKVTGLELRRGLACLDALVKLLPLLSAVVMVGRNASRAKHYFESTKCSFALFDSYHPSPLVKATSRAKWEMIPSQWARILTIIGEQLPVHTSAGMLRCSNQACLTSEVGRIWCRRTSVLRQ